MSDVHTPEVRSYNMSKIKSKDTKPEMYVRKFLFSKGLRYRLHAKNLPGKPDLVLKKYRTVIFVNGCFWHGHEGCNFFVIPKTKTKWWTDKIEKNRKRDSVAINALKREGWRVLIVWECDLRANKRTNTLIKLFHDLLNKNVNNFPS